jgi:carboxymethylenebutenolidase
MRLNLPSGTPYEVRGPSNPEGNQVERGLVIAPDIFGLRPLFDDMAERLVEEQGWAVCVVEPFPGEQELDLAGRRDVISAHTDERHLGDLLAAADITGATKVGVMGFCMGGMYAFKAASTGRFHRAVSFYGMIRVPEDWQGPGQAEPLELLASDHTCPTLAILGGRDQYTPPEDIEALRKLDKVEAIVYDEADHGFVHDPDRPTHRPDDAADAWAHAIRFLTDD